jgi:hypothetical protein
VSRCAIELQNASGAKVAQLSDAECSATVRRVLNGEWSIELQYTIPTDGLHEDKSAYLKVWGARIRVINLEDATDYQTFIVREPVQTRGGDGSLSIMATGEHIAITTLAAEMITAHYDFVAMTAGEMMAVLFPAAHIYSAWHAGTVDSVTRFDLTISWETPLSALQKIAAACQAEIEIIESATSVGLRTRVGADKWIHVRPGRNMTGLRVRQYSGDVVNQVYGVGGGKVPPETMAGARHVVHVLAGDNVTVHMESAKIIPENDSWNGYHLHVITGALAGTVVDITDCIHNDTTHDGTARDVFVAISSLAGLAAGDKVYIEDYAGNAVPYVRAGASIASYGTVKASLVDPSMYGTINLVKTPCLDAAYAAGLCGGWTKVGTPTPTENTDRAYITYGAKSQKVVATADGQGVSQSVVVTANRYHQVLANVYVASGAVRLTLAIGGGKTYPTPAVSTVGWNTIEIRIIKLTATPVTVSVVQDGATASTFYVDSVQVAETAPDESRRFTPNCEQTALWEKCVDSIIKSKDPVLEYECRFVDLNRMAPTDYPFESIALGDGVVVTDDELGISGLTLRVKEMQYSVFQPELTEHTVSNL